MPHTVFQDDKGNFSSFRAVWIPLMLVLSIAVGFIAGLLIKEILSGGDSVGEWLKAFFAANGTLLGGLWASIKRKQVETQPTEKKPLETIKTYPKRIVIDRVYFQDCTPGFGGVVAGHDWLFKFRTIELPNKNNEKRVSCIPEGTYNAIATRRASNGQYAIWIQDVPGRSEIMIHVGNSTADILGCIAPGEWQDGEYLNFVKNSRNTINKLEEFFPLGTNLTVTIRS